MENICIQFQIKPQNNAKYRLLINALLSYNYFCPLQILDACA